MSAMGEKDIIMFPPEDIGLCNCDNSEDLGMIAQTVVTCLRCEQDNCPVYQIIRKTYDLRDRGVLI